jgi:hypothetical protein
MHRLQELVRLHRLGEGAREVARKLGISPNTEREYRKVLAEAGLLDGHADELPELAALLELVEAARPSKAVPQQQSSVEHWRAQIETLVDDGAQPTAIYDRLRLEHKSFNGSL